MSIYDVKIQSLEELPSLKNAVVISDCDETLFEHGTTTLYPDVNDALTSVGYLALVSANPDRQLMEQRQTILNADLGISSNKPIWYKGKLFNEVAQQLGGLMSSLVIMGDRSVADIGVPKYLFGRQGYDTLGIRIARPNKPITVKADFVLRSGFAVCSKLIKMTNQETHFRPKDEDGHKIAKLFLSKNLN